MTRTPEGDAAAGITPEIRTVDGALILGDLLPCGCWTASRLHGSQRQFLMEPCAFDCKWFRYAVEESERQGMPIVPKLVDTRPRTKP